MDPRKKPQPNHQPPITWVTNTQKIYSYKSKVARDLKYDAKFHEVFLDGDRIVSITGKSEHFHFYINWYGDWNTSLDVWNPVTDQKGEGITAVSLPKISPPQQQNETSYYLACRLFPNSKLYFNAIKKRRDGCLTGIAFNYDTRTFEDFSWPIQFTHGFLMDENHFVAIKNLGGGAFGDFPHIELYRFRKEKNIEDAIFLQRSESVLSSSRIKGKVRKVAGKVATDFSPNQIMDSSNHIQIWNLNAKAEKLYGATKDVMTFSNDTINDFAAPTDSDTLIVATSTDAGDNACVTAYDTGQSPPRYVNHVHTDAPIKQIFSIPGDSKCVLMECDVVISPTITSSTRFIYLNTETFSSTLVDVDVRVNTLGVLSNGKVVVEAPSDAKNFGEITVFDPIALVKISLQCVISEVFSGDFHRNALFIILAYCNHFRVSLSQNHFTIFSPTTTHSTAYSINNTTVDSDDDENMTATRACCISRRTK